MTTDPIHIIWHCEAYMHSQSFAEFSALQGSQDFWVLQTLDGSYI